MCATMVCCQMWGIVTHSFTFHVMSVINVKFLCDGDVVAGRSGIGAAVACVSSRRRCAVRVLRTVHSELLQR